MRKLGSENPLDGSARRPDVKDAAVGQRDTVKLVRTGKDGKLASRENGITKILYAQIQDLYGTAAEAEIEKGVAKRKVKK